MFKANTTFLTFCLRQIYFIGIVSFLTYCDASAEDTKSFSSANSEVRVSVTNGTAFLDGFVQSKKEYNLAGEVASKQKGIVKVVNNLKITNEEENEEEEELKSSSKGRVGELAKEFAIKLSLLFDQDVSGLTTSVDVQKDKIVVSGEVDTKLEKKLLAEKVSLESGDPVVNKLSVGSGKSINEWSSEILNILIWLVLVLILAIPFVMFFVLKRDNGSIGDLKKDSDMQAKDI